MAFILTALIGYLLGSLPLALLWARRYGIDLYATSDGNPGAWNALEQLGGRRALPAFVGDGAKGLVAGLAGRALGHDDAHAYVGVAAAMLGHCFPLFSHFRGGKAIMTFAGGALALSLVPALICYAALALVGWARGAGTGARVAVFGFPLVQAPFDGLHRVAWTGALMCIIGLRFLVGRRSAPARSARAGGPRA